MPIARLSCAGGAVSPTAKESRAPTVRGLHQEVQACRQKAEPDGEHDPERESPACRPLIRIELGTPGRVSIPIAHAASSFFSPRATI
jgi:hypothetical protein